MPRVDQDRQKDCVGDVLEEVHLAALRVAHFEPVSIGQPLAVVSVASVGVAELWRLGRIGEGLFVQIIELAHELAAVDDDPSAHSNDFFCQHILQGKSEDHNQSVQKFFRQLELSGRDCTNGQIVLWCDQVGY